MNLLRLMDVAAQRDDFAMLYARYHALPEGTKAEIVAGTIRMLPRPLPRHARAASVLGARLLNQFDWDSDGGLGGWVFLDEPELRLKNEIRAPDLAGWRVERYQQPEHNPIELVPDWICEVLSPSTARFDRQEKMPLYASCGVNYLWMVDPAKQTLEVYRREGAAWALASRHSAEEPTAAVPFEAAPFDLGALWRRPRR